MTEGPSWIEYLDSLSSAFSSLASGPEWGAEDSNLDYLVGLSYGPPRRPSVQAGTMLIGLPPIAFPVWLAPHMSRGMTFLNQLSTPFSSPRPDSNRPRPGTNRVHRQQCFGGAEPSRGIEPRSPGYESGASPLTLRGQSAGGETRTPTGAYVPPVPETGASTNSATPARSNSRTSGI